jgi:uncharacterized protein YgiM (DUF1202 family)
MGKLRWKALVGIALALVFLTAPLSALAAAKTVNILKVSADGARLRDAATAGEVLTTLAKGTKVFYLGRTGGMAYVCTEHGVKGYVYAGYLETYGAVRLANIYYVKSSSLSVYQSASTSSKRLGAIPKNGYILLYKANGNWGYIKTLSGKAGYVLLSGLKKAA